MKGREQQVRVIQTDTQVGKDHHLKAHFNTPATSFVICPYCQSVFKLFAWGWSTHHIRQTALRIGHFERREKKGSYQMADNKSRLASLGTSTFPSDNGGTIWMTHSTFVSVSTVLLKAFQCQGIIIWSRGTYETENPDPALF